MLGNDTLNIHIFSSIEKIREKNPADLVFIIQKQLKKLKDSNNLTDSFSDRMKSLINAGKLLNKNNCNAVFYYVNQEIIYKSIVDLFSEMIPPDF